MLIQYRARTRGRRCTDEKENGATPAAAAGWTGGEKPRVLAPRRRRNPRRRCTEIANGHLAHTTISLARSSARGSSRPSVLIPHNRDLFTHTRDNLRRQCGIRSRVMQGDMGMTFFSSSSDMRLTSININSPGASKTSSLVSAFDKKNSIYLKSQ